ncbi:MAG: D-alanyl-D-alanine carboxypeptidase [Chitinispirillales bacterium]|nr:D-alanyl-D-alanine carboxypeptidase [Chitinispirillales bacterium]
MIINTIISFMLICVCALPSLAKDKKQIEQRMMRLVTNGSVLLLDEEGTPLISHRADELFVPASIIKILTSAIAYDVLGADYRFKTEIFVNNDGDIAIKGWGDPYLISEEIDLIAKALSAKGITKIKRIYLDHSNFADQLHIPGISYTANPYNALNGALVVNFNTLNLQKNAQGQIFSAEEATPLTPLAVVKAVNIKSGAAQRINLSANPQDCRRYAGELFIAIFEKNGINAEDKTAGLVKTDENWNLIYTHLNSNDMAAINTGLQKYSNNFIANQLFLTVGAAQKGYPASLEKSKNVFEEHIISHLKIPNGQLVMEEGSGISRNNRVSANVMGKILRERTELAPLLPEKRGALAKSGTLTGVSNYAGYIKTEKGLRPYVIMLNQREPNRDKVLDLLVQYNKE